MKGMEKTNELPVDPVKGQMMSFEDALVLLKQGKRIARESWFRHWIQMVSDETDVCICYPDDEYPEQPFYAGSSEILSNDWYCLEDAVGIDY